MNPYIIEYPDGTKSQLNPQLVERQGISKHQVLQIQELHIQKFHLFAKMQASTNATELKSLAKQVEALEFELQRNWQFPLDANFHEWYLVPQCSCPKLDNRDSRGTPFRHTSGSCRIHG